MDARHFDALVQGLAKPESRRRLLALLATVPVVGGLLGLFSAEEADGQGRRRRRKKAHKHGRGRRRKHKRKKQCTPESTAQTCAGKCGSVTNTCNQPVDCGSCACTPLCEACFVCQDQGPNAPGVCVLDPMQEGDACGDPGQVCQSDGSCGCDATSCPDCTTCGGNGQCAPCTDCCDGSGVCQDGDTNAACGNSGTCDVCTGQEVCQGQTCVCIPNCAGKCGGAADGCGGTCTGACATGLICIGQTCVNPQGTCPTGANQCAVTGNTCNSRSDCFCRISTEGETRCGGVPLAGGAPSTCGECASTAECLSLYPGVPGAFCMAGGTGCCNGTAPKGNCVAPCPS